jgi:transposase
MTDSSSESDSEAYSLARYRFWNHHGKEAIYDSCLLPTVVPYPAAAHAMPQSVFTQNIVRKSGWEHITYAPPHNPCKAKKWGRPFRDFDPKATPSPSYKRAKTMDEGESAQAPKEDDFKGKHDKRPLFRRLAPLDGDLRTVKVLMLPTKAQKMELKRCFSIARHAYNFALDVIKTKTEALNFLKIRALWAKQPKPAWCNEKHTMVNSKIQAYAIKQCVDAHRSNFAKGTRKFDVKFRSIRWTKTETLVIEKDSGGIKQSPLLRFEKTVPRYKRKGRDECLVFFGNNLAQTGGIRLTDSSKFIQMMLMEGNRLKENAKIHWDKRTGKFHFIYMYVQPKLADNNNDTASFDTKRIVAMDPGVTPFQEFYSPHSGKFGSLLSEKGRETMISKCKRLDNLQSRIDKRKLRTNERRQRRSYKATTRRLKRKLAKEYRRVHGWMESAHYDAANFLLKDHEIIIQPVLAVSKLIHHDSRVITGKVARSMCTWSHYKFRQRLKSAAARYPGRYVFETNEPGTSKTCTHCGFWNANLGAAKIYHCPRCHIQVDRQLAGARNNLFSAIGQAIGMAWDGGG